MSDTFYTDKQERIRRIVNNVSGEQKIFIPPSYNTIKIPYQTWIKIHEHMEKMDMPTKIERSVEGFSANTDALVNSGFWFCAMELPEIAEKLKHPSVFADRFNIIITDRPNSVYGGGRPVEKIEKHEEMHVKYDNLPLEIREQMISSIRQRADYSKLCSKLIKNYGRDGESEEDVIQEWYVRCATDPLDIRIWLGAQAMPGTKQWKLIDKYLKVEKT